MRISIEFIMFFPKPTVMLLIFYRFPNHKPALPAVFFGYAKSLRDIPQA